MKVIAFTENHDLPEGVDQAAQVSEAGQILNDLHERGILERVFLRKDVPGVVMMMECGTLEDAHQYMEAFPGVKNGSTSYQLTPLGTEIPPNAFLGFRMVSS